MTENNEVKDVDSDASDAKAIEPRGKYESLLYRVYKDQRLSEMLHIVSYIIVFLTAYAFLWRLLLLLNENPKELIALLVITGVPFIAISVIRRLINAPRPYELIPFYEKKPKGKSGRSFPSRHVFSVFVIATVLIPWNLWIGIGLALLGCVLAALRVILGIHFIRDVVAGALTGIACGVIGIIITVI